MFVSSSSLEGGAETEKSVKVQPELREGSTDRGSEPRREYSIASSYGGGAAYFSDSDAPDLVPSASEKSQKPYESLREVDKDTPLLWGTTHSKQPTHIPRPRQPNTPRSILASLASESEGSENPIYYHTDSEQSLHTNVSLGLTHKTLDQISSLFRKHADGSFLSERAFVRSLQTVEPILYASECSKLFEIYDDEGSGYVPYNTVVKDLQEIEVNGAMQAPILHFLSLKIAEHSIESNDLQSVFHFLVQGVRGLEILQRERAAWDETKMRTIIASTRNHKHDAVQSNPRMALRGLMLEFSRNLLRSQSENQTRTARMLAEIESYKDEFEIQLQLMDISKQTGKLSANEDSGADSEIHKVRGYVQQLHKNIETHEQKLSQYDAYIKSASKRVIEEERLKEKHSELNRINSNAFDFTDRSATQQLETEITESQNRLAKLVKYPSVIRIDFQDFFEIRKALLDKIHDSLRATKNEKIGLTSIVECSEAVESYRNAISQLWELSLCMANLLRGLSLVFWALLCIAYGDYAGQKN